MSTRCSAASAPTPSRWARAVSNASVSLGTGADTLTLANGTNTLTVANVATIVGGTGDDTVTLGAAANNASVNLGTGNDSLTLGNFANTLTVGNVTSIIGGAGTDNVTLCTALSGDNPAGGPRHQHQHAHPGQRLPTPARSATSIR